MSDPSSAPWDAGRFINTLAFFETLPFLGSVSWIRELLSGSASPQSLPKPQATIMILVIGETLAQQVVQPFLAQGYPVRVLVSDRQRAPAQLGSHPQLSLVEADLTRPETLKPELMQGVEVILGDLAGDGSAIANLIPLAKDYFASLPEPGQRSLFNFRQPSLELQNLWGALDDVVMGGVSASEFRLSNGVGQFTGRVSTANSGGFASIRTRNLNPPLDLSHYQGIALTVRGDGQRYKFFVRPDDRWDGIGYAASFDTVANTWITIRMPFKDFIPVLRAKTAREQPPLDPKQVYSFQVMLSKFEYDGALNPQFAAGQFRLEIATIDAFGGPIMPRWLLVNSNLQIENLLQTHSTSYHVILPEPGDTQSLTLAEHCLQALSA